MIERDVSYYFHFPTHPLMSCLEQTLLQPQCYITTAENPELIEHCTHTTTMLVSFGSVHRASCIEKESITAAKHYENSVPLHFKQLGKTTKIMQ